MENNQPIQQSAADDKKPKKNIFPIVFAALVLVGGTYGVVKYMHAQKHEETEDAQVEALISPVIPRVPGYIKEVRVKDNQVVRKGDTLLILDDRDFKIRMAEIEAGIAAAQSNVSVAGAALPVVNANVYSAESNVSTVDAQIEAAKVNVWRATQDFNRYQNLIKDHSITQQQFEQAMAAKQTAERQLDVLKAQRQSAARQTAAIGQQRNVSSGQVSVANAAVKQRMAELEAANLNLSYTIITAVVDGQVSKINLQPGQLVQAGQGLFNIVPSDNKWVVANFKETQLAKMKAGQKVTVKVDAYPDHEFEAKVSSFSPATGSKFSLLPPDNASGNFVKTVQRVPVKIEFTNAKDEHLQKLRAGMNVGVDVHLN